MCGYCDHNIEKEKKFFFFFFFLLKDKILKTYQLPLQTSPTTVVNNNSKEEEDGGTDIYGYCDHNIEKEKKVFFFFLEAREENIK